ncbi:TauD/TfdA dioxygenase family protein [Cupriavidus sp. PET2-C1]
MTILAESTAHSHASRPRPRARGADTLEIRTSGRGLGAFVTGLDAHFPLDAARLLRIRHLLQEHRVLILPGQTLDKSTLADFASYFGMPAPAGPAGPEAISIKPYLRFAHIDRHWAELPSAACLLYAAGAPHEGSEIRWIDLLRAYADLDAETKWQLASQQIWVRSPSTPPNSRRPSAEATATGNAMAGEPGTIHPLVRTHPELGKPLLFLSSQLEVDLQGIGAGPGHALIERLRAHIAKPQFSYTHRWQRGDLVWWDNQAVLHAHTGALPSAPGTFLRVDLAGARPF